MTAAPSKFDDLTTRLISALVLLVVGLGSVWLGGFVFLSFLALATGCMVWELSRMLAPNRGGLALILAGLSGAAVFGGQFLPAGLGLPLLLLPAMVALSQFEEQRRLFALYSAAIALSAVGLYVLRQDYGVVWMLWLALIVIASDVLGYFAGRLIGGPKFWPKVSPKKTWSGTIAGWIGAALVALLFVSQTSATAELIGFSVSLAMAAQMGDIAESAIKRKTGVKDSSGLIPGHGGVLDRFDGMLGASLMLLAIEVIADFPPLPGAGL